MSFKNFWYKFIITLSSPSNKISIITMRDRKQNLYNFLLFRVSGEPSENRFPVCTFLVQDGQQKKPMCDLVKTPFLVVPCKHKDFLEYPRTRIEQQPINQSHYSGIYLCIIISTWNWKAQFVWTDEYIYVYINFSL